ncbi:3',5'-cyclic-nucleotide phosphodiesterase [Corallococcus praedator]|uniref:3',5'-cyclic-nucleotide phosphodiesterase n=1 Tax=Corallococcus praedator TaxID=2316724 RepID=A0ABX9QNU9_9BACT|nr:MULTISPECIES: 3',5'-cyclic-nucleotide phosphodiesterase [Corallococcus]RKH19494.1 3',5'-cyclic-nucleotide phosphodiesterase [Corallococcus sp. CA047B]RKH33829.1 3',5'-cyclic-nucleotide phosphodiesterase [Corallococcus sp. CA031C]RKI15089.1 3',5'-cyclic-nucleotide phosphodiesterase [Corallococcus praedator]
MKLQVLGCHGGELPTCRSTCFLVDDVLALDAGALTGTLSLEQLCKVDDILVGHSHFDHVKDLPLLADLVIGRRDKPVTIHASRECARALRENMFNNALWPDFTRIPTRHKPVLAIKTFRAGSTFQVGPYTVRSVPVSHPVESCAFIISDGKSSLAMSGDTGPTDKLWKALNATKNLKALLLEASFPNSLQALADISGHLTPATVGSELRKFDRNGAQVMLYHLKPAFIPQLKKELAPLPVNVLELGETFQF